MVITICEGLGAVLIVDIVLIILSLCGVPGFDLPMCITLGAIASATAPAATLMVIRQYKAKGPVCEMLLPVVAMDDALGLMAYAISISVAQAMVSGAPMTVVNMALIPLGEIVGSLVIGTVIGFVLSLCMSFFHSRGNKLALTIAAIFLALGLCDLWGLSNLLCIMMIGAVMTNVCKTANVVIEQTDRFTPPLFLLFFVISGAQLNLGVLPTVGLVGVCYVLFRVVGKWLGRDAWFPDGTRSPQRAEISGLYPDPAGWRGHWSGHHDPDQAASVRPSDSGHHSGGHAHLRADRPGHHQDRPDQGRGDRQGLTGIQTNRPLSPSAGEKGGFP